MADDQGRKPQLKYLDPNYGRYKRSQKHEQRLGKRLGGKRIPRSGGMPWSKWDSTTANGDISVPKMHLEHKRTDCASMSVQKEWLTKVSEGARRTGKDPGVVITFEKRGSEPDDWVLIPLEVLERLLKKAAG
jgi:hypothetical protein